MAIFIKHSNGRTDLHPAIWWAVFLTVMIALAYHSL